MTIKVDGTFGELIGLAEELRRLGRRETCLAETMEAEAERLQAEALRRTDDPATPDEGPVR